MFMSLRENLNKTKIVEEDFGRPVESIMKCDDFKSNFARRLSNRYIVRSPSIEQKHESSLRYRQFERTKVQEADHEDVTPLPPVVVAESPKTVNKEKNDISKTKDKLEVRDSDVRETEVAALNIEVETLRWQLAQTEANRQMHIALLEQVINFLNKVKEHMKTQKHEIPKQDLLSDKTLPRCFNGADLPRSRSVLHVNKSNDFSLNPGKRLISRKISKSISNVNGFHQLECSSGTKPDCCLQKIPWKQSKSSILHEASADVKLVEEMTRLITLANTVLSTKLPDLACGCHEKTNIATKKECKSFVESNVIAEHKESKGNHTTAAEAIVDSRVAEDSETDNFLGTFILNTSCESADAYDGITNKYIETRDRSLDNFLVAPSSLTCGLEDDFAAAKIQNKDLGFSANSSNIIPEGIRSIKTSRSIHNDKKFECNNSVPNYVEDESGFSSMSSFQEIGIPIINIIPPTPSKESAFASDQDKLIDNNELWKAQEIELDKDALKVFWV